MTEMNRPGGVRRRSKDDVPRPHMVKVRLSDAELAAIGARAAAVGLTVPGYLAERGAETIVPVTAGQAMPRPQMRAMVAELYALKRILRGAATNLNQCARIANSTGQVPAETWHQAAWITRTMPRFEDFVESLRAWMRP